MKDRADMDFPKANQTQGRKVFSRGLRVVAEEMEMTAFVILVYVWCTISGGV